MVEGRAYTLIHNPLRAKSVTADVEKGCGDRPCFLCQCNRPSAQDFISITIGEQGHTYHLAVNPYPILSHHFTIIAEEHSPQTMMPQRLRDMECLAQRMTGYLLFFNGAKAGASAPDHFHFQAVRQSDVPLVARWDTTARERLFVQTGAATDVKIDLSHSDTTNILCWCEEPPTTQWVVVERHKHRPQQYYAAGDEQLLLSPAALEYAGVVPLIRAADYAKMTAERLAAILRECYDSEPLVDVGLCHNGETTVVNADGTTTIRGIHIGRTFHWEQPKDLSYEGTMILRDDQTTGQRWRVNRLQAERYVESVVCSEMAATANIPFLQAQAVVARSWLVRQLQRHHTSAATHSEVSPGTIIRWYDAEGHTLFDVCAEDHCQRYYGITAGGNSRGVQAIRATRGEVLTYAGAVVDARFAKCCGGRTEEYGYCWENIKVPYLTSVPDTRDDGSIFCDTHNANLLRHVLTAGDLPTRDFFAWEVAYTQEELSAIVEEKQHAGIGMVTALIPLVRGRSGRISRLRIVGTAGSLVVGKELEIRRTLSRTHLYSSAFDVLTTLDGRATPLFTLRGHGWGHGVGLCQIGAAVRGAEGYTYKEILAAYYKDAILEKIW